MGLDVLFVLIINGWELVTISHPLRVSRAPAWKAAVLRRQGFGLVPASVIAIHCLFTATPNADGATAAMTTNCGQLPAPNSVVGAATLTTASPRRGARGARSSRWQADPHRRRTAPRSGSGAAALPAVSTCGRPRSYGLRQDGRDHSTDG
jgi:hypothetical protein